MLRKAYATALRNSEYSSLADYFLGLGHSSESMSDRHYASVKQLRFDAAVNYLRGSWLDTND